MEQIWVASMFGFDFFPLNMLGIFIIFLLQVYVLDDVMAREFELQVYTRIWATGIYDNLSHPILWGVFFVFLVVNLVLIF